MGTVTVKGYRDANQTLAVADLKQSLYDEGRVGSGARRRRLLEMRIFKKDFFKYYGRQILPNATSLAKAGLAGSIGSCSRSPRRGTRSSPSASTSSAWEAAG